MTDSPDSPDLTPRNDPPQVIVEVPKIEYHEEIIERQVESTVVVPKYVEVPQIQERIYHQHIEQVEEEIVEVEDF